MMFYLIKKNLCFKMFFISLRGYKSIDVFSIEKSWADYEFLTLNLSGSYTMKKLFSFSAQVITENMNR